MMGSSRRSASVRSSFVVSTDRSQANIGWFGLITTADLFKRRITIFLRVALSYAACSYRTGEDGTESPPQLGATSGPDCVLRSPGTYRTSLNYDFVGPGAVLRMAEIVPLLATVAFAGN